MGFTDTARLLKIMCLGALVITVASGSRAQDVTPPIPERLVLHSTVLGEDRVVYVRVPSSYRTGKGAYPTLYVTDGESYINEIGSVIDFLAENQRMPELIVVGIVNPDRFKDLTPTRADITKRDGTIVLREPTSGGADRFLSFIETELIPEVEKRYRTEAFRVLVGHSLGGLFALHALMARPALFQGYIATSPSLEWDNEILMHRAEEFFRPGRQMKATLFFSLSDEGTVVKRFADDFEKLKQVLTSGAPPGLEWDSILMTDEDHDSGVLRAHYAGLRKIFAHWQFNKEPVVVAPADGPAQTARP